MLLVCLFKSYIKKYSLNPNLVIIKFNYKNQEAKVLSVPNVVNANKACRQQNVESRIESML